jgi:hypothetical protein
MSDHRDTLVPGSTALGHMPDARADRLWLDRHSQGALFPSHHFLVAVARKADAFNSVRQ